MSEPQVSFPAVVISSGEVGEQGFHILRAWADLAEGVLADGEGRIGWEIIDSAGARWKVVENPVLRRRRGRFLVSSTYFVFAPRLERLPRLRLDAFKARACAAILSDPYQFGDDEVVAGEANEPVEQEVLLEARCALVQSAKTNAKVIEALDVESEALGVVRPYADQAERNRRSFRRTGIILTVVIIVIGGLCFYFPPLGQGVLTGLLHLAVWLALFVVVVLLGLAWSVLGDVLTTITNHPIWRGRDGESA